MNGFKVQVSKFLNKMMQSKFVMNISKKLKILGYPKDIVGQEEINDEEFANIIMFLEDRVIRHYEIKERDELRNRKRFFEEAFERYMISLKCPTHIIKSTNMLQLQWFVIYSISLMFEEFISVERSEVREKPEIKETTKILKKLALDAEIAITDETTPKQMLQSLNNMEEHLKKGISKAIIPKNKESLLSSTKQNVSSFDIEKLPLGFTTGEKELDNAATILRMLYIEDLRKLQNEVNEMLVQVQEFTANPKTDSSLGRVGR